MFSTPEGQWARIGPAAFTAPSRLSCSGSTADEPVIASATVPEVSQVRYRHALALSLGWRDGCGSPSGLMTCSRPIAGRYVTACETSDAIPVTTIMLALRIKTMNRQARIRSIPSSGGGCCRSCSRVGTRIP
jgi:hypothetical protein